MNGIKSDHSLSSTQRQPRVLVPVVGYIASLDRSGHATVSVPTVHPAPIPARTTVQQHAGDPRIEIGTEVLVVHQDGDPTLPVIIGVLHQSLFAGERAPTSSGSQCGEHRKSVDGELVIEASEGVILRSGKGMIRVAPDGRVLVRGTEIVSRASGCNKVKGGSVQIN